MPSPNLFWFLLGREPLLSAAELVAVLKLQPADYVFAPPILKVVKKIDIDADNLINKLGGTIKIAREIGNNLTKNELLDAMLKELYKIDGKINFGISLYSTPSQNVNLVKNLGYKIKNALKTAGRSVRFVYNDEPILSSVTVEKNGLTNKGREFILMPITRVNGNDYTDSNASSPHGRGRGEGPLFGLAITRAVQPFAEFSARDYGRPGRDDKSGMLPPKLAMMMVNLAINQENKKTKKQSEVILDPFCGSGTILTEAALLGINNLIGSDISEKAITDTQTNFNWMSQPNHNSQFLNLKSKACPEPSRGILNLKLFQSNAADLSTKIDANSIDAIITEPYLGPPLTGNELPDKIKKTCIELASLYVKAFEQFKKVLKPNGAVVIIIPRYTLRATRYTISDKIIPRLKELGFAKDRLLPEEISPSNYLLYHRPGQFVAREVWRFKIN